MTDPVHRNALPPGYKLGWYEIRSVLGQGGFGITYLALDGNLNQEVAIKEYLPMDLAVRDGDHTLHPASGLDGEQFQWGKDRFISEARTLAQFKHPNIVRIFSVFEALNTAYMIMEYESGESLQDMLSDRRTLGEEQLLAITLPIMDGLRQVHAAGFIHRDIKPANIFIRADGSPVLLDFGSARQAMSGEARTLTTLISPGYAPFEQYHAESTDQGPWTDIYGLGATLYRAATGVAPKDALERSRLLLDTSRDPFVSTRQLGNGRYSNAFLGAIDHALQFRQADRPQSIGEWMREFTDAEAVTDFAPSADPDAAPTRPGRAAPSDRARRKSKVPYAVALAVIALAGAAYWVAVSGMLTIPAAAPAGPAAASPGEETAPVEPTVSVHVAGPPEDAATGPAAPTPPNNDAAALPARQAAAPATAGREPVQALRAEAPATGPAERSNPPSAPVTQTAAAPAAPPQDAAAERARRETTEVGRQAATEVQRRRQAELEIEHQRQELARLQAERRRLEARQAEQARKQAALARAESARRECEQKKSVPVTEPPRAGSGAGLYFGAIAIGADNGWGEATGYASREEAEQVALEGCRERAKDCRVEVWSNDCIALATGPKGAAGWSWGESLRAARDKATGYCEAHGACCNVVTAYCADELAR